MPGYMPVGTLPDVTSSLGYQLLAGSPRERMTESGMEAQLTFAGPPENRFKFISDIFGVWNFNVEGGNCCAAAVIRPKCYSLYFEPAPGGIYPDNLWPDTFDIRPMNDPSPIYDPLTAPTLDTGADNYRQQIEWGVAYSCPAEITVNYRSKRMAWADNTNPVLAQPWPDFLYQLNQCSAGEDPSCLMNSMPVVQDFTYIDFNMRSESDVITIPGRQLEFVGGGTWPVANPDNTLPDDVNMPLRVMTADIEVTWSNVPLPDWDELESCKGTVNSVPIWGYPDDSVLFEGYEYRPQRTWYNLDLYTIITRFTVKLAYGVHGSYPCFNQFGIWNRRWCSIFDAGTPMRLVVDKISGDPPYRRRDLRHLWKFPAECAGGI